MHYVNEGLHKYSCTNVCVRAYTLIKAEKYGSLKGLLDKYRESTELGLRWASTQMSLILKGNWNRNLNLHFLAISPISNNITVLTKLMKPGNSMAEKRRNQAGQEKQNVT